MQRQEDKFTAAKSMDNSFESVARAWFDNWAGHTRSDHAKRIMRRLEADVFPLIGKKPITEITAA